MLIRAMSIEALAEYYSRELKSLEAQRNSKQTLSKKIELDSQIKLLSRIIYEMRECIIIDPKQEITVRWEPLGKKYKRSKGKENMRV